MKKLIIFLSFLLILCTCVFGAWGDISEDITQVYRMEHNCEDSTGNNDMEVIGTLFNTTGINFLSIENNGVSSKFCNGTNYLSGRQSITFSFWSNLTSIQDTDTFMAITDNAGAVDYMIDVTGGAIRTFNGNGKGTSSMNIFPTTNINNWALYTYVGNSSGTWIYWNGTELYSDAEDGRILESAKDIRFFTRSTAQANSGVSALMDEIYFWNRSLTAGEVLELYNNGAGTFFIQDVSSFQPPTPPDGARNNTQVNINVSCSAGNVSLWFDSLANPLNLVIDNTTQVANWTTNVTTQQTYYYKASCDSGITNSSTRSWTYDISAPTIILNDDNFFSSINLSRENQYDNNVTVNISLNDNIDLFAFQINITKNGIVFFNLTNVSLSGTEFTFVQPINTSNWDIGTYDIEIMASDSHTALSINEYDVQKKNNKLTFDTEEQNTLSIESQEDATPSYTKLQDRYSFAYNFDNKLLSSKTFIVKSDKKIIYRPNSQYKAHFIIWNQETKTGNWIDFEEITHGTPIVNKVSDYEYTVTFEDLGGEVIFNSIGGLNVVTENYEWYRGNTTLTESNNLGEFTSIITLNISKDSSISDIIANLNYNNTFYGSPTKTTSTDFILFTQEVTNPTLLNNENITYLWNISVVQTDLSEIKFNKSSLVELFVFGIDNCTDFNFPIFNLSYFDQTDNSPITLTNTYDLLFSDSVDKIVQGSFTGNNKDSFCSSVNLTQFGLNYTLGGQMTLTKDEYATKLFDITFPVLLTGELPKTQELKLIKLNESTTIQFTWLTSAFQPIDGTMVIYECVGDGTRNLVSSVPIIDGEASENLELLTKTYSYDVVIDGVVFQENSTFTLCHIESSETRRFFVKVEGEEVSPVTGIYGIDCTLTKEATNNFLMVWNNNPDSDSTITGCITGYIPTILNDTQFFQLCDNDFKVNATVSDPNVPYYVTGRLFQNGVSIGCGNTIDSNIDSTVADLFGLTGLFSVALLVISMAFMFASNGENMVIGSMIGVGCAWFLGLLAFGWSTISLMISLGVVILLIGRYSRKRTQL